MQASDRRVHGAAAGLQKRLSGLSGRVESCLVAPDWVAGFGPWSPQRGAAAVTGHHALLNHAASGAYEGAQHPVRGVLRSLICLSSEALPGAFRGPVLLVENPSITAWISRGESVGIDLDPRGEKPGLPRSKSLDRNHVEGSEQLVADSQVLHRGTGTLHTQGRVISNDRTTTYESARARCPQIALMLKKTKNLKSLSNRESDSRLSSNEETAGS